MSPGGKDAQRADRAAAGDEDALASSEPARLTACSVTAKGSAKAASLIETPSAILWH